jgi:hypothetical protein
VLLRLQEATELGLFVPSWPPSEPRFCAYPDFPSSFGRIILRTSPARRSTEFGQEVAIISQMRPVLPRITLRPSGDEMRSEAVFRLVTDQ